jgi:DNA replication protein DnaC
MRRAGASLFFRLVTYRYCRAAARRSRPTAASSGLAADLRGRRGLTAAILDRLLHKSVVLNIRGRSYRLRDLEKLVE